MKKKRIIVIVILLVLLILITPIPMRLKDGGSIEYSAILYKLTKIHRLKIQSSTGYEDGWKLEILGIPVFNNVKKDNYEPLEYTSSYDKGYYFDFNIAEKINSKKDISNILNKINRLPKDLVNKLNSYDEEYFKTKDLILIYFPMGSGTPTSSLDRLNTKDNIEVIVTINDSGFGTDDMSGHLYVIEIQKSDKNLVVYTKINDEQPQILKSSPEFSKTYKVKEVSKSDNDSKCQYVTLSSMEKDDEYEMLFCDTDYITFEQNKMYKFTFTPYGIPSIENSIKNMMLGNFIKIKIEETTEIINEDICDVDNRYFMETNNSNTCDSKNGIKLYSKMKDYNIYTYCTDDIYVINKNDRISLKDYLKDNDSFIDKIISKMDLENIYDGTTTVYRGTYPLFNNDLTLVKCSNKDIYITDEPVSFTKEPINFCN